MKRLTAGMRIALALSMWSTTVLLTLRVFGVFDDGYQQQIAARTRLCESIAVACSELVSRDAKDGAPSLLSSVVQRNPEVLSAAWRGMDNHVVCRFGPHDRLWEKGADNALSANRIYVPMLQGSNVIGRVELSFQPFVRGGLLGYAAIPSVRTIAAAALLNLVAFALCLHYCLQTLDPKQVVPDRVRSALDTIADGLVVVDDAATVVLANEAYATLVGRSKEELQGTPIGAVNWLMDGPADPNTRPWHANSESASRTKMRLDNGERAATVMIGSAPIYDDDGAERGRLVTFNDVTVLEQQRAALAAANDALEQSKAEVEERNEQLEYLATRDPMTGCLNRRSFFQSFEEQWKGAQRYDFPLSCIMVDVDHFKSINDTHGHAMGDEVLIQVASALRTTARETDFVCRYGGEEFCILLPHVDVEGARQAAERFREAIGAIEILPITASLGVSDMGFEAESPEGMLEQADQCLYVAKRNGRNQVVTFQRVLDDDGANVLEEAESLLDETGRAADPEQDASKAEIESSPRT